MKAHIGTKVVNVQPMTRQEYNDYRRWTLPADEAHLADEAGFLIEDLTAEPNDDRHGGYISWVPARAFNYQDVGKGMTFGHAVELAKRGHKIARIGWNGKGMWVIYNPGSKGETHACFDGSVYKNHGVDECVILPHFDMYTVNAHGRRAMLPGWLASQSDIDAEDWVLVE